MNRLIASTLAGFSMLTSFVLEAPAKDPASLGGFPAGFAVKAGDQALSAQLSAKLKQRSGLFALDLAGLDTATSPPAATRPPLTTDALKKMLDDLGYAPQEQDIGQGAKRLLIKSTRSDWTIPIFIGLAPQQPYLVMGTPLASRVDAAAVKSSAWQELLSANALVSPNAYVYMEASKDLVLMRVERNLDISPASMRAWVDSIIDVTIAMHPKWKQFSPPPKS